MIDLRQAYSDETAPFQLSKRTRRVVSSASDIVEHIFSNVNETKQIISKTASTHDVNIGRCDTSFKAIQNRGQPSSSQHSSSLPNTPAASTGHISALSAFAAAATAAAIRTSSSGSTQSSGENDNDTRRLSQRSSSSSWESSAVQVELSADLLALSVAASTLADNIKKFNQGHRTEHTVVNVKEVVAIEQQVKTCLGPGHIVQSETRDDGFLVVQLKWALSNNQHAMAYVLPSALR